MPKQQASVMSRPQAKWNAPSRGTTPAMPTRRYPSIGAYYADIASQDHTGVQLGQRETQVRYVLNVKRVVIAAALIAAIPLGFSMASLTALAEPQQEPVPSDYDVDRALVSEGLSLPANSFEWAPLSSAYLDDPSSADYLCYDQGDARWGDQLYQTGSIAGTGCGLCSAAHCLTMLLDEAITPDVLAAQMQEYSSAEGGIAYGTAGTVWDGWEKVLNGLYGDRVSITHIPCTTAAVKKSVQSGSPVVYNVPQGFSGIVLADGATRTTYGGHVLVCYRYEDGYFYVKDSSSQENGHGLGNAIKYTEEQFEESMQGCQSHLGYVHAFTLLDGASD